MQLISVQILRALAALAVTIGHAQVFIGVPLERMGRPPQWGSFLPYGAGVDLFFAISGFIMVYSSERLFGSPEGRRVFIWRRITRIVPLYWCALALMLLANAVYHKPQPDIAGLVTSFLFIPYDSLHTGEPRPFYELGWTLNCEMFFYAVFAAFLGLARNRAVAASTAVIVTLVALGSLYRFSNPLLYVWTQPILLEFGFGMAIALLARRDFILSDRARYALAAAALAMLLIDFLDSSRRPLTEPIPNDFMKVIAWGLPTATLLAAAVLARAPRAPGVLMRAGAAVGDASYALYLFHPMALAVFSAAWHWIGADRYLSPRAGVAIGTLVCVVAALVIYRFIERPVTRYLQSKQPTQRTQLGVAA